MPLNDSAIREEHATSQSDESSSCTDILISHSVPSVKSLISSLQSVLDQERIDYNIASNIYEEACEIAGVKELKMPRVVEISLWRSSLGSKVNSECLQELLLSAQDYPSAYNAIQIIARATRVTHNNC
ncbi:unnamed protein product [Clavelina lepadiformis]|uniref:Uncharacterized protein n=1 Tax=Clavelina lepadiformis TaxID=159417 RepID=A0ABP0FZ43_CLALP